MGVPVPKDYYRVTLLDQLKACFDPSPVKQWVLLEQAMVNSTNLQALLIASATNKPIHIPDHPSISSSLTAWKGLLERRNAHTHIPLHDIPLQSFEFLIPDLSVKTWLESGYSTPE